MFVFSLNYQYVWHNQFTLAFCHAKSCWMWLSISDSFGLRLIITLVAMHTFKQSKWWDYLLSWSVKCAGSNLRWFSFVDQYWSKEGKEKEAHCGVSIFSRWTHPSFKIGGKSWGFYIFKVDSPQFSLPAGWKRIFLSHRTPPEYCAYCTPLNIVHNCA